ncbi:uncharacterized protein ZBIST_0095 [Zygosaccharomyces bailii]|nr:uncharacterized protein ZBIST_0095 [Zygosaccharomyces bailii]
MFSFFWYGILFVHFFLLSSQASPVAKNNIQKAFETQDKICSMKYAEKEGSYKKMFEMLSGLEVPAYLKEYNKKPFTGFKVLRTYNVKFLNLALASSIDFIFCKEGKVQWIIKQPLQEDLNWSVPLCVYTPHLVHEMQSRKGSEKKSFNTKRSSPRNDAQNDLSNFHCFKLARRKKYTNRKASFFYPRSWIGGIFYCDLTDDMKRETLNRMHENLVFKRGMGEKICTRKNSIPLVPLQSDDYSKNWLEFGILKQDKSPFRTFCPQITKYVPYINTPNDALSRLNFENCNVSAVSAPHMWRKSIRDEALSIFQRNKAYSHAKEPWYSEIEVEEDYKITSEDISLWEELMERTIDELGSVANLANKSFLSSSPIDIKSHVTSKGLLKKILKKIETKIWNRLQLHDKIISIVGDNPQSLENLGGEWENLQMNREKFDYLYEISSELNK